MLKVGKEDYLRPSEHIGFRQRQEPQRRGKCRALELGMQVDRKRERIERLHNLGQSPHGVPCPYLCHHCMTINT